MSNNGYHHLTMTIVLRVGRGRLLFLESCSNYNPLGEGRERSHLSGESFHLVLTAVAC